MRLKMEEYKEQLEQLESYQSQELGKVKHMLLVAEASLAEEREKNKRIDATPQNHVENGVCMCT